MDHTNTSIATGLLLLVRVIILTIFTLNQDSNLSINLLAIAVIAVTLQTYITFIGVYKKWLDNILENVFLLNVGFLAIATFYQLLNDKGTHMTTTVSISITFTPFVFITVYHGILQLLTLKSIRNAKS